MEKSRNSAHELVLDCIYKALLQLMETQPYEEISITDITKKAGVSRMAYYRNYEDKGSILIKKLEENIHFSEERIESRENLSKESLWREIIADRKNDLIFRYILRARLVGQAFPLFKDSLIRIYSTYFGWDMTNEDNQILLYQRLGSMFGFLMYLQEKSKDIDTERLVAQLMQLVAE